MKSNKKFKIILAFCIMFIRIGSLYAQTQNKPGFTLSAGIKGIYNKSDNTNNPSVYPFLQGGYTADTYEGLIGYTYILNYQLIDDKENYHTINIHSGFLSFQYTLIKNLFIDAEANLYNGDLNYKRQDYTGSLEYNFNKVTIGAEYGYDKNSYTIDSVKINNTINDFTLDFCYYFLEYTSIDITYVNYRSNSSLNETLYSKNSFRLGLTTTVPPSLFILFGINASKDTNDYTGIGADLGLSLYINKTIKLSLIYQYMYFLAGSSSAETQQTDGTYIISDVSYSLHTVSFGITYKIY